jgi:hypothetical protein
MLELLINSVDLDDPRETDLAWKFMIEALTRVTGQLPPVARNAAALANRFSTGVASLEEMTSERVRLWEAISGREGSDDPEVPRIRAALCVLYPPNSEETFDIVDHFLSFWQLGGLENQKLEAALENNYHLTPSPGPD